MKFKLNYGCTVVLIIFISNIVKLAFTRALENINILFIADADNDIALKAFTSVLSYLENNTSKYGVKVQSYEIKAIDNDSKHILHEVCKIYPNGISKNQPPHLVLDATKTGSASETIKSITKYLGLPTISSSFGQNGDLSQWRNLSNDQLNYLLQVMPPNDIIPEVIRQIVLIKGIMNAAVLYDKSFVMDHKYKSMFQNTQTRHILTEIPALQKDIKFTMKKLTNKYEFRQFFILGRLRSIRNFFESLDNSFFTKHYGFYAITNSIKYFNDSSNSEIVYLKPIDKTNSLLQLSYLHSDPDSEIETSFYFDLFKRSTLAIRDMLRSQAWPKTWEYLSCENFNENNTPNRTIDLRSYFTQISEPTTYGNFFFPNSTQKFNGFSFLMYDLNLTLYNNSAPSQYIGKWQTGLNHTISFQHLKNRKLFKSFATRPIFKAITIVQPPLMMKDDKVKRKYKGFCVDIFDKIAETNGFDYDITEVPSNIYGYQNDSHEWNGAIKMLIDKKADFFLCHMGTSAERDKVVDFTVPFYDLIGYSILIKKPNPSNSIFDFLRALHKDVWLCIVIAYIFTSFLMWIFVHFSPHYNIENFDIGKRNFYLKDCLWFCITSLTPQGGGKAPSNPSARLVAGIWWLYGFIIIASYTANLPIVLNVSDLEDPIKTLDDLASQHKYSYATLNKSDAMRYFESMSYIEKIFIDKWTNLTMRGMLNATERSKLSVWDYPISNKYSKMWKDMKSTGFPETLDEAIKRVQNSKSFAFIADTVDVEYIERTHCDLMRVGKQFSERSTSIALQQGSALKLQFNDSILKLLNKREFQKIKEKWWKIISTCEQFKNKNNEGIGVEHIGGIFILIFIAIATSMTAIIFNKIKK